MTDSITCWLVSNSNSGSNTDDAVANLRDHIESMGWQVERQIRFPDQELPTVDELESAGQDRVVVYTGDGTLRSLLTSLEGWSGAVLVLPGGTTNLLSKAIHGDRPLDDILADIPRLRRIRHQCIRSDAGPAVIEVVAGPGAKWSDVREGMREGDVAAIAGTTLEAVQASAGESRVAIVEPKLGKREGYSGVRLTPFAEGIAIDGYGAETVADYFLQGVALLQRDFRNGPHDELGLCHSFECASIDGSDIELMLDGERACGPPRMTFSLAELDVDLLSA